MLCQWKDISSVKWNLDLSPNIGNKTATKTVDKCQLSSSEKGQKKKDYGISILRKEKNTFDAIKKTCFFLIKYLTTMQLLINWSNWCELLVHLTYFPDLTMSDFPYSQIKEMPTWKVCNDKHDEVLAAAIAILKSFLDFYKNGTELLAKHCTN